MERDTTKHSPRLDDQMKGRGDTQAEEFRRDSLDEDQQHPPFQDARPDVHQANPEVMDPESANVRAEIARFLEPSVFPARADELVQVAERHFAPDGVVERLRMLPDDRYETTEQVFEALGGEGESHRT